MRHSSAHSIGSINLSMPVIRAIRDRLSPLARGERGMALPTALFAMIAAMGLASVAVLSSVDVQQGSARDHDSKEAIAAADAGASVALLRLNRFLEEISAAKPCVGPAGEGLAASEGWCPAIGPESVGGASYTYRVSAYDETGVYTVVATGSSGKVSRRVEVGLNSYSGGEVFGQEKMLGEGDIRIKGGVTIRTDIGTNGDVILENEKGEAAVLCGDIRHGTGGSAPEPDCDGEVTEGEKNLPEVKPPEDIATNNSNCRLVPNCLKDAKKEVDPYQTASKKEKRTETNPWDATNRTINLNNNAQLTMGGTDYFVCGIFMESGELIMAAGANVRIFVDTPENCGLEPGATQVKVTGNANIVSTGYNPSQGTFEVPGIYVLGESKIELEGAAGINELVLYAPKSEIDLGGTATWKGMFAGKTMYVHGNPTVESDPNIPIPDINWATLLERTRYVECTGGTASPPDASC